MSDQKPWVSSYPEGIAATIPPLEFDNIPQMLRAATKTYGPQKAWTIALPNGVAATLTFNEADRLSDDFARYLREHLGLEPGARVAIQMPNSLGYAVCAFGVLKAGCVLVNVNPLYTPDETDHQLEDSGASVLILIDMFASKLKPESRERLQSILIAPVTAFFPKLKGAFVQAVLKYVKKTIPKVDYPHTTLAEAMRIGREESGSALDYEKDMTRDSLAALQYTGGTTGVSKGAMLTHGNLMSNVVQSYQMLGNKLDRGKDCCMTVLPLYHIFSFSVNLLGFYHVGGWNILVPSPRPLSNLKRPFSDFPITWITGVNTLFKALCNEPWFRESPPRQLKASISAGMALERPVAEKWTEIVKSPIVEGYGLTEASPTLTFNPFGGPDKPGSIGIPIPDTDIRLLDESGQPAPDGEAGELWATGPQIMAGYWNRPDATAEVLKDGWLATGDIASMDEDGFFRIEDRKKDMIIVSGFNVFPNQVEAVIARLESVLEVAVVGVPDEGTGEAVRAFVVRRETTLTESVIVDHCREHLTRYKVPRSVEFRDELPKSTIGKILRRQLKPETGGS